MTNLYVRQECVFKSEKCYRVTRNLPIKGLWFDKNLLNWLSEAAVAVSPLIFQQNEFPFKNKFENIPDELRTFINSWMETQRYTERFTNCWKKKKNIFSTTCAYFPFNWILVRCFLSPYTAATIKNHSI